MIKLILDIGLWIRFVQNRRAKVGTQKNEVRTMMYELSANITIQDSLHWRKNYFCVSGRWHDRYFAGILNLILLGGPGIQM